MEVKNDLKEKDDKNIALIFTIGGIIVVICGLLGAILFLFPSVIML